MRSARKVRVTVTLSPEVARAVDREAARGAGRSRSSLIEEWLARVAREHARRALDDEIARYYEGLGEEERREDAEWARTSAEAFVVHDREDTAAARRGRRRPRS